MRWHKYVSNREKKYFFSQLTHWGRVTHICVSKLTIIASDNGLSPGRRQANIWNNAGILSIGLLWTNFSEILIEILTFSFRKMRFKVSSILSRPQCVKINYIYEKHMLEFQKFHCRCDGDCNGSLPQPIIFFSTLLTHPPRTKWPPFRRRHFQVHLLEWKCRNFDSNFNDVYS